MAATVYGDYARIVLCSAVTAGTAQSTKAADSGFNCYIKCEEPEIGVDFSSKIKIVPFNKNRLAPDVKFQEWCNINDGIILSHNASNVKEAIMDAYIAKTQIYLLVAMPAATGTPAAYPDGTGTNLILTSWYTNALAKVYYLKGVLGKLKIKLRKGRVYHISFDFKGVWLP